MRSGTVFLPLPALLLAFFLLEAKVVRGMAFGDISGCCWTFAIAFALMTAAACTVLPGG